MRTENRREADVIGIGRRVMDRLLSVRMTTEEAAKTVSRWADRFWLVYNGPADSPEYQNAMDAFCEAMLKSTEPLENARAYTVTLTIPVRVCVPIGDDAADTETEDAAIDKAVCTVLANPSRYIVDNYVSDVEMDRYLKFGDVLDDRDSVSDYIL